MKNYSATFTTTKETESLVKGYSKSFAIESPNKKEALKSAKKYYEDGGIGDFGKNYKIAIESVK